MAFDLGNIGGGVQGIVATLLAWAKFFAIVFFVLIVVAVVLILFWMKKRYPYSVVVIDVDRDGRIRNVIRNAKAGRVRKETEDGTKDYFIAKIQGGYVKFNSPNLIDEIHKGGGIGTLLLARFENNLVAPMIGDKISDDEFSLKVGSKITGLQQLLIARDIDEMTKIKKNLFVQIAPYMIILIGFMIVGFFLLAILQQIGELIAKISVPVAPVQTIEPPPAG